MTDHGLITKLRARLLYSEAMRKAHSTNSAVVRLPFTALAHLLEWPEVNRKTVGAVLAHMPDTVEFDWDVHGLTMTVLVAPAPAAPAPAPAPAPPTPAPPEDSKAKEARVVFDYWRRTTGRSAHTLYSPERRTKIMARLKEGFSVETMCKAVDGIMRSSWHNGAETGRTWLEINHVFRDATTVEKFSGDGGLASARPGAAQGVAIDFLEHIEQQRQRRARRRGKGKGRQQ